jgi:hypothetical protein
MEEPDNGEGTVTCILGMMSFTSAMITGKQSKSRTNVSS